MQRVVANILMAAMLAIPVVADTPSREYDLYGEDQREAYYNGVRDALDAVAWQLRGYAPPLELLNAIEQIANFNNVEMWAFMESRYEPLMSGRLAGRMSQSIQDQFKARR